MYRAFGWEPPEFCHLPMVMGSDGKKLSKRHGATSLDEFRRAGYLADALINYIALVGASYTEGQDLYTLDELAAAFSLDKLNKAPAVFDYKKLDWYNGMYIRAKTDAALAALALPFAIDAGLFGAAGRAPTDTESALFTQCMPLVKERAVRLTDIPPKLFYIYAEPPVPEAKEFIPKKADLAHAKKLLEMGRALISVMAEKDDEGAEAACKAKAEAEAVKLGDLLMPLRVAITGARVSPPLFGSVRLLGAEKCLARVDRALQSL
jgi:glutamyl-tRNA synthetase